MITEKVVKLSETELETVCGGDDKTFGQCYKEGFATEFGKQTMLLIGAPIIVGVATGVSVIAKWGFDKLTGKIDKKMAEKNINF